VPHLLGRDSAFRNRGIRRSVPLHATAVKGRQELRVEARVLVPQPIVRRGWRVVPKQLLGESSVSQCRAEITSQGCVRRESKVGIAGPQGQMVGRLGQGMEPMEPVRPAANHHQLAEPRSERRDEVREGVEVLQLSGLHRRRAAARASGAGRPARGLAKDAPPRRARPAERRTRPCRPAGPSHETPTVAPGPAGR